MSNGGTVTKSNDPGEHCSFNAIQRVLLALCRLVVCGGLAAAMLSMLLAFGASRSLPASFQLPGTAGASKAIQLDDGKFVVPLEAVGRIQVYSDRKVFLYGWRVDASGGAFEIATSDGKTIDVYVGRGSWHRRYTEDGRLLSQASYNAATFPVRIALTPPLILKTSAYYLLPIVAPEYAWLMMVVGALGGRVLKGRYSRRS